MKSLANCTALVCFVCLATFLSCDDKKGSSTPNDISYETIEMANVYHLDNDSTKPSCSLQISYVVPTKYTNDEVLKRVVGELNYALFENEDYMALIPKNAAAKYIQAYVENYKEETQIRFPNWANSNETEDYFSFYKKITTQVLFDKGDIISYQISTMDYKGGANSSTYYYNLVFDLKSGKVLSEEDIFIPEYKDSLSKIIIADILRDKKVQKPEDLIELGYYGIEDLASNNNFSVDNDGITYIFNQGEYSAYSLGETRVTLSYKEIYSLLKPDSPIFHLFQ